MSKAFALVLVVFCLFMFDGCNDSGENLADGDFVEVELEAETALDGDADQEATEADLEQEWQPEKVFSYTEEREPCKDYNPYRNLYFGDLHSHSRHSWDAYGYDLRVTMDEVWGFAKGEKIMLTPLDAEQNGTREIQNDRALDFASLTDHIEYIGEYELCTDSTSTTYNSEMCEKYRAGGHQTVTLWGLKLSMNDPEKYAEICGDDGQICRSASEKAWQKIVDAADKAYDKTEECSFVSFPGYEYTNSLSVVNYHRNIIFRNDSTPTLPPSYFDQQTLPGLYDDLESSCTATDNNCEVMVIPHNSNWSNGNMFTIKEEEYSSEQQKIEALKKRAKYEPVFEVFQHKGDMECKNGFEGIQYDPLCEFEKIREADFLNCGDGVGMGGANSFGCLSKLDYVRNVYLYGLKQQYETGYNPYKFGLIGSTDTHNAAPGYVAESKMAGHVGNVDDSGIKRLTGGTNTHQPLVYNGGGLVAVWAQEKSRDAIFESMKRAEVYSTSGPRISVRFFGGWDIPEELCSRDDLVYQGYKNGVPMGSDLPKTDKQEALPVFVVDAYADEGTENQPGTDLQVVQIIKGWIDKDGETHLKIFDVAGNALNGADVDEESCVQTGEGARRLCAVWVDQEFKPEQNAFYYVRVVENPSCRWVAYDCINEPIETRPAICSDSALEKTIQERALSSPIWYEK